MVESKLEDATEDMERKGKYDLLPSNECALCRNSGELRLSHILSKFFGKALKFPDKKRLIDGLQPHRSDIQDLTKKYLLCESCEKLLNQWETEFRNNIMPADKCWLAPISYGEWMLGFAVSISWRVLTYLKFADPHSEPETESNPLHKIFYTQLAPDVHQEAEEALETWRTFLLGERDNVGRFIQHILVLNGKNFPHENSNAVGFTVYQEDDVVAIHTLLGQFIILGFIKSSPKYIWKGSEISAGGGLVGVQTTIPKAYFDWLAAKFQALEDVSLAEWTHRQNKSKKDKGEI